MIPGTVRPSTPPAGPADPVDFVSNDRVGYRDLLRGRYEDWFPMNVGAVYRWLAGG